ncbi:DMT family transporter [Cupriavidus gilardii]|uniref:DMT family transporter n=1 Tax=Cupriavidus gilardii TaxID=82541 RepID=A0ABY4VPL6_9BURK|nr:DMT family transporter [Cupriavidus gilardii]QQE07694.1 DMT family transporter [Cupriavidus sp. ISTL7]USE79138.1 DMT family transporter [Cupriavidus gilardii]UXC35001.1 DMT family transporter [Cupriavidus gilardii]
MTATSRSSTLLRHAGDKLAGVLLIAISASAFGAMAIFARLAYDAGADVYGLLSVRFVLAAIALAAVMRWQRIALPPWPRVLALAAMGGIGYVGQSFCFFSALNHAQASLVALLLYLYPVFVTVMAALFLKEKLTGAAVTALVLCSVGAGLTVGGGEGSALGIGLGLASALIYSVYIIVGARLTPGVHPVATTTVVCVAAAVVYVGAALVRTAAGMAPRFPADAGGWLALAAIALLSTVLAILTFFAGLQRLGAAQASMLSTLEPVVTVLLAALLLGEQIGMAQAIGGGLILAGVLWLTRKGTAPTPVQQN